MRSPRFLLILLILISISLRWELVRHGGQLFNPDEYRYLISRVVAKDLLKGHCTDALTEITREADHVGFKIIGVLPALVEATHGENILIPSFFFSTFSTLNIVLIWLLALKLGADEAEAVWAAFFMATSNALFYYSPHLFPYDPSLTFGLAGLYISMHKTNIIWISALTGILGFLTFFTYNGYWTLAALVMLVHVFQPAEFKQRFILRSLVTGVSFITPLALVIIVSRHYGNDLLHSYAAFSQMITNGVFSEGATLPFKYLWASEYSVFIIWLALLTVSLFCLPRNPPRRILLWLGGLLFLYASFVILSVLLHKFVVYARLVRQLVPFLALISAYGLRSIQQKYRSGYVISAALVAVVLVQTAFNFHRPFLLTYPRDLAAEVHAQYPDFVPPKNMTFFYTPNMIEAGPYRAYNVKFVFPLPEAQVPAEEEILMNAVNPLSAFLPFRFDEGYSPTQRVHFPLIMMTVTRPR